MINPFSAFALFCFRTLVELATGPGHVCNFVALSNEIRGIPHGGKKAHTTCLVLEFPIYMCVWLVDYKKIWNLE